MIISCSPLWWRWKTHASMSNDEIFNIQEELSSSHERRVRYRLEKVKNSEKCHHEKLFVGSGTRNIKKKHWNQQKWLNLKYLQILAIDSGELLHLSICVSKHCYLYTSSPGVRHKSSEDLYSNSCKKKCVCAFLFCYGFYNSSFYQILNININ